MCPVRSCLARQGGDAEVQAWADLLAPRMALMPDAAPLFRAGTGLQSLYAVRGGCIKTYTVDAEGNERIRGFHLPGDIIGLDALGSLRFHSSAAAVTPSQVCVAPVAGLRRVLVQQPQLAQRLMDQASRELSMAMALSGDFNAEQRLAAFLLNMEQRLQAREGLLRLPMPQRDIGNYLRLATETVCRTLKGFERKGWMAYENRGLRIKARAALQTLAEPLAGGALPAAVAAA
jgi:CRP/FNR family transcriptional regulator